MTEISPIFQDFQISQTSNKNNTQEYINKSSTLERNPSSDQADLSTKKNKKKKIAIVIGTILAAATAICGTILAVKHGKSVKLQDIKFDKGIANLKNGEKFTGKIKDTLKNGDKITLEYIDGVIQKSTRQGSKSIEKAYQTINNEKVVNILENGVSKKVNITQIQNEVIEEQSKLKNLLKDNAKLTPDEFKNKTDKIKFKNRSQQQQIDKIITDKNEILKKELEFKKTNKDIKDITYNKGIAYFDNSPYKGKVYTTLPNGDKVVMEYDSFGQLIKSERSGKVNFTKEYDKLNNSVTIKDAKGTKIVSIENLKKEALQDRTIYKDLDITSKIETQPVESYGYTFSGLINDKNIKDPQLLDFLEKNKDITPDDVAEIFKGNFKDKRYDIPDRFMLAVDNQVRKTGSALIVDDVPELFKGIEPKKIAETMDKIPLLIGNEKGGKFVLDGKNFKIKYIGGGCIGNVYKISDEAGNNVTVKYFKDSILTGLQGIYSEIPVSRQASLEGVKDVPKFFMANPQINSVTINASTGYRNKGGWQMVEYIDKNKQVPEGGNKLFNWLNSKGLIHGDINNGSKIGDYIVDLGGIMKPGNNKKELELNNLMFNDTVGSAIRIGVRKNENILDWIELLKKNL